MTYSCQTKPEFILEKRNCIKLGHISEDLIIKFAETEEEYEKAFNLLYKSYLKEKVIDPDKSQLKLSLFNALPTTKTFIIIKNNEVVTTLTVIYNSNLGLPVCSVYGEEIKKVRSHKLVELGSFASELNHAQSLQIMKLFLSITGYYCYALNVDYACISTRPKHRKFYEKMFLFDTNKEAGIKYYDNPETNVKNVHSILLMYQFKKDFAEKHKNSKVIKEFDDNLYAYLLNEIKLNTGKMDKDMLRYFFVKKTDIFKNTERGKIEYISNLYPEYDFNELIG